MSDCSEGGYVVRAQGLDSEVTGESEARMPNEGFSAPKGALAERRYTAAPSKRPQDSTQTVSLLSTLVSSEKYSRNSSEKHRVCASGYLRGKRYRLR